MPILAFLQWRRGSISVAWASSAIPFQVLSSVMVSLEVV